MSRNRRNVLVFPGGTEIALEIHRALSSHREVQLSAAGQEGSAHGPYVFKSWHTVPSVFEDGWAETLDQLIRRLGVDYVYPAHDDALLALAENAHSISARLLTSPLETCRICRYKSKTYHALGGVVRVPHLYLNQNEVDFFPVFLKPDRGQGSQGIHVATTREDLSCFLRKANANDHLILEYLPGREFTVDCFSDRERGLLFCGGRERARTRSGISIESSRLDDPRFIEIANNIATRLKFHGAWFFQVKESKNGELVLLEVAPRIAGTMALNRVMGVNFPLLTLYEHERKPVQILVGDYQVSIDRALTNRYKHNVRFSTVYIDLDDTLIIHDQVNTQAMQFLYQCVNQGKKIVLVTKHKGNLHQTLRAHRLVGLFHDIIHLTHDQSKSNVMVETDSILIDDSFSERVEAYQAKGMATFDCSMIEMLIDQRC